MTSQKPLFLLSGPCAFEDYDTAIHIAQTVKQICDDLGIEYIFKASYKKANRTKLGSFTGIGKEEALKAIQAVGEAVGVKTITDVHESHEPEQVAEYIDCLQIPAFLCRQTDLLVAAGKTGKAINLKKGQFLSPEAMGFALEKIQSTGNDQVWLCERGTTFGYSDLIVDATSMVRMKRHGVPVVMDCTHAVQKPNQTSGITGGDASLIEAVALSAVATGADGLFIETHPTPHLAKSDAQSMLQLDSLRPLLEKVVRVRKALATVEA
ncbi:3-deoxy-8-phosphooctulonate synthase [Pontibacter sp. G13]|uniref:3-deoxy-8-phosphooctulonate synthase n=1 Tax=Pontibacter sp. G13 TaxID=3074898 RepID=UPI00288B5EE7|nr:3-deoxy-8-phosphooctulonate synthase [Pontibacter sp. G13]WNJ17595.1 3-deoxy-8-phosphooctulonate synthase [Pontibacter sp. G13]